MKLTLVLAVFCAASCLASLQVDLPSSMKARMIEFGRNARYGPYTKSYSRRLGAKLPKQINSNKALADYLLPTSTVPLAYDVKLIPYLTSQPGKEFTFDGESTTRIRVVEATTSIVMHAWDLTISQIGVIRVRDGASISVVDYTIVTDDRQFFTINMAEALEAGQEYDVVLFFAGILNDEGFGFFRSAYTDENGNAKWLTQTQFESTGARRAFPCYDEPNLKATFTMHLAREPGFTALANMPIDSEGDPVTGLTGWVWVHFQKSVVMPSYLVAFSTNEFLSVGDSFYKTWARPEVYLTGAYAAQIAPQLVAYNQNFTGHLYSLPKMDQIGMIDFFSGAMENWGLLAYQEPYLLYDPLNDDSEDYQLLTIVVSHEIAHQWFGDLVTTNWWNDIWLNEGFATYFENFATTAVGADWQLPEQFIVDTLQYALRADSDQSRPISMDANTIDSPNNIDSMFDSISYQKGGSIVYFMVNFLGENNFRMGIDDYLTANGFGNAAQGDLFSALAPYAPANMPVSFDTLMQSWTTQAGFPLLTVTRNYAAQTATISQARFGFSGPEKWVVPITSTRQDAPNFTNMSPSGWLLPQDASVTLDSAAVPGSTSWFMINLQETGFYRVNYDVANWRLITDAMKVNALVVNEKNRAQLMDDAMTLATSAILDYDTALRTTDYLAQETRLAPWKVATYVLEYPRDRVYQTVQGVLEFQTYMQERMATVYASVNGFTQTSNDPLGMTLTRRLVTRWACDTQLDACNTDGAALFETWRQTADPDNNNPIALDLRTPAYCAGQRRGGQAQRDFLLARYQAATSQREEDRLLSGMGCTTDLTLLQSLLDLSLTPTIKNGDALQVLFAVYSHPEGLELAFDFLLTNWRALDLVYGNIGYGFVSISDKLNTQDHLNRLVQFSTDNAAELGAINQSLINSAINTVQEIVAWNTANLATVMAYFTQA